MKDNTYHQLEQLVNAYFHQDWSDEHDDEEAVIADFVRTTWRDEVQEVILQIDHYLSEHANGLLESFVSDFNPMIVVGHNDAEAREWLEHLHSQLTQLLPGSPTRDTGKEP